MLGVNPTADAPKTDPSLFRYASLGSFDDIPSNFGPRLPKHHASTVEPCLHLVSEERVMSPPKTLEEMTHEMHTAMFDPMRKLATSEEVRTLRDAVSNIDAASQQRHESHEGKDDMRHREVLQSLAGTNARVSRLEEASSRKMSPAHGMQAVSVFPAQLDKTKTGLWSIPDNIKAAIECEVADLREANAKAEEAKRVAEAERRGAETTLVRLAADQAAKDAARRQAHVDELADAAALRSRHTFWLGCAGLTLAVLTGVVFHLLHL